MNRRHLQSLALGAALVTILPVAAQDADLGPDVSQYRRFLIHPHLHRAFRAMQRGDRDVAIAEFEHARRLAPRNPQTALYLAEAYRRFDMPARAREVLAAQRAITPDDPRLDDRSAPAVVIDANQATCADRLDTENCRSRHAYRLLRAGDLRAAAQPLADPGYARSTAGIALRRDIAQRAIDIGDANAAIAQFQALQALDALRPHEIRQWWQLAWNERDWAEAMNLLQRYAVLDTPGRRLLLGQALAADAAWTPLRRLLRMPAPRFGTAEQEQQWFDLLHRAWSDNPRILAAYPARHVAVRVRQANMLTSRLLAIGAFEQARQLLRTMPAAALPQERFALQLALGDTDGALQQAQRLLAGSTAHADDLDVLSYRLLHAGAERQAVRLLLDHLHRVPDEQREPLLRRLAELARRSPSYFDAGDRDRLATPLSTRSQALAVQAETLMALDDCPRLLTLLNDLSAPLEATAWRHLGVCWQRANKPGLAQHAYAQALRQTRTPADARMLAMQAFAAGDHAEALRRWNALTDRLNANEFKSAALAALAEGDQAQADLWLRRYAQAGGETDAEYWWWRANLIEATQPRQAILALEHAQALDPQPRHWRMQAQLYQRLGEPTRALDTLQRAHAAIPNDDDLTTALGYAQLQTGRRRQARITLQAVAARRRGGDAGVEEQLAYLAAAAGDGEAARLHLREALQALPPSDAAQALDAASDPDAERRFALRRAYEQRLRRWTFNADLLEASHGTASGARAAGRVADYRSFGQIEAGYRPLAATAADPEALSVYARLFAGSGDQAQWLPREEATIGVGLRWKPLRAQTLFIALERQRALNGRVRPADDTLLRISAGILGDGRFSDDWHPRGRGWWSQNLYLDLARQLKRGQTLATADYRIGRHHKLRLAQTLEPFGRLQWSASRNDAEDRRELRAGLGMRWHLWHGQNYLMAWPHRLSIGLERQYALKTDLPDRHAWALTLGGRW